MRGEERKGARTNHTIPDPRIILGLFVQIVVVYAVFKGLLMIGRGNIDDARRLSLLKSREKSVGEQKMTETKMKGEVNSIRQ